VRRVIVDMELQTLQLGQVAHFLEAAVSRIIPATNVDTLLFQHYRDTLWAMQRDNYLRKACSKVKEAAVRAEAERKRTGRAGGTASTAETSGRSQSWHPSST
jgi:hypothetical protein